jgi:hypothetical protein
MGSYGILIGQPEERPDIAREGMVYRAALFRDLDALEPLRKSLRHILLNEPLGCDAAGSVPS